MRNFFLCFTIAIFLVTFFEGSAQSEVGQGVEKYDLAGIENYSRMEASNGFAGAPVGFGGSTDPGAAANLKGAGYASIINLRLADEPGVDIAASRQAAKAAGINYVHLPIDPENLSPTKVNRLLDAIGSPVNQPVYIHCNSATRVGMVWMVGRVLRDNWTPDIASREVRQIAKSPDEAIALAMAYLDEQ